MSTEEIVNHYPEVPDFLRSFVLNNTYTAAFIVKHAVILEINQVCADLVGYERSELIGHTLGEFLTPDSLELALSWIPKLQAGESYDNGHIYECFKKDGTVIYIEPSLISWDNETGIGVVIAQDVTERKKSQDAILERFRYIDEHSGDLIWQMDLNGIVLYMSPAISRYGYTPDEWIGQSVTKFVPPHEQVLFLKRIATYRENPVPRLFEATMLQKDGSLAWVEVSTNFIMENGVPIREQGIARDISKRKKAEAALIASEDCYRSLVEQASDGIFLADSDGQYIDVNTCGCTLLGYTKEELLQMCIGDIVPAEDQSALQGHLNKLRSGAAILSEWNLKRKDGKLLPAEISAKQLSNGQFQGIVRDITRRKSMLEALKASEQRYRGLIESQQDLIVRVDLEGRFTFVNNAYCRMFGKTEEELLGMLFMPLVHEDDIQPTIEAMKRLYSPPYRIRVEQRAMTVNGWRWLDWEDCAILDDDGKIVEIQAIGQDITERKKTEEALKQSEAKNRAILNTIPDLLFITDKDGVYLDCAALSDDDLLIPKSKFIGNSILDVLPEPLNIQAMQCIKQALCTKALQTLEYQLTLKGLTYEREARYIVCGEDEVLIMVRDVTERKRSEEAIRQAHEDLERAYKLQRDFLNNVTHEVRTPLTAVQGYAEMLLEGLAGPLNSEQRMLLDKMLSCSDQLLQIVGGVLEIAKLKSGRIMLRPRVCNPACVVDKAISVVMPQANRKGLTVTVQLPKQQTMAVYDEEKLTAIVTNLLSNAVKFTETGEISVTAQYGPKGIEIIVIDTGMGINPDDVPTIFDEFSQLDYPRKAKPSGFGLGLAIVSTMVETIGGTLTVSSQKCLGTAFTLWAPALEVCGTEELGGEISAATRD